MTKEEILKKIKECELDKNEIIVISGASLVVQGIIERTDDIDFTCSKDYYTKINWPTKIGAYGLEIKYRDIYEIGSNLYYPESIIEINGTKYLNLQKCLEIKKELNRPKDQEIIKKLENILTTLK